MPPEGMEIPGEYLADMADTRRRLKKMADVGGLKVVFSGRISNSRLALEATEYAYAHGRGEEFHRAVFQKLYAEGQHIGNWEVLREAAINAGLDAGEMESVVKSGEYAEVLEKKLAEAASLGVKAVPTFVINDSYRIVGAQPYEVFEQALAAIESAKE